MAASRRIVRESAGAPKTLVPLLDDVAYAVIREALQGTVEESVLAAELLHRLPTASPEIVANLVEMAEGSLLPQGRLAALRALGIHGQSTSDLRRLFEQTVEAGRLQETVAAARALSQLGALNEISSQIVGDLNSTNGDARFRALAVLSQVVVAETLPGLVALVADQKSDNRGIRLAAAAALGPICAGKRSARDVLVGCLRARDAGLKATCADALAVCGQTGGASPSVYKALSPLFRHTDNRVVASGVRAAGQHSPQRFLRDHQTIRRDAEIALATVAALARNSRTAAVAGLGSFLSHNDENVRVAAARALAQHPNPKAREKLESLQASSEASLLAWAVHASKDPPELQSWLSGPDDEMARAAAVRLAQLRGRSAVLAEVARRLVTSTGPVKLRWVQAWLTTAPFQERPARDGAAVQK